jgi:hypothetical protein
LQKKRKVAGWKIWEVRRLQDKSHGTVGQKFLKNAKLAEALLWW